MKLLPSISLMVFGAVFLAFALGAFAYAPPTSLDGRAVFLVALLIAGGAFEALGLRDLIRAKRLASSMSAA